MTKTQQIHASIRFSLPNDPIEMASTLSKVAAAWQTFSDTVRDAGISLEEQSFAMPTRVGRRPARTRKTLEAVSA